MIIEYTREAICEDCQYCGFYFPLKKNGKESKLRRYKCKITGAEIRLSKRICEKCVLGFGVPIYYDYIKVEKNDLNNLNG